MKIFSRKNQPQTSGISLCQRLLVAFVMWVTLLVQSQFYLILLEFTLLNTAPIAAAQSLNPVKEPELRVVGLLVSEEILNDQKEYEGILNRQPKYATKIAKSTLKQRILRYAKDIQAIEPFTKVMLIRVKKNEDPKNIANVLEKLYFDGDDQGQQNSGGLLNIGTKQPNPIGGEIVDLAKLKPNQLKGIVVLGDVPLPVVNKNGNRFPSIFPYVDFVDKAYLYNRQSKFFEFNGEVSNPQPEIWHGVIKANQTGDQGRQQIAQFLDKSHLFHDGDPDFKSFEKKIFFADLWNEWQNMNKFGFFNYDRWTRNWEDLAYGRFNKHLIKKLYEDMNGKLQEGDKKDNDGDGKKDEDPVNTFDDDGDGEDGSPLIGLSDGIDNDGDGEVDEPDEGFWGICRNSTRPQKPQNCAVPGAKLGDPNSPTADFYQVVSGARYKISDGIDNDGDGVVDEGIDEDDGDPFINIDNDRDGLIDEDTNKDNDKDGDGKVDEDPKGDANQDGAAGRKGVDDDNDGMDFDDDGFPNGYETTYGSFINGQNVPTNPRDPDSRPVDDRNASLLGVWFGARTNPPVNPSDWIDEGSANDDDEDGQVDEDGTDDNDNDGDGLVDEDPADPGLPQNPFVNLPDIQSKRLFDRFAFQYYQLFDKYLGNTNDWVSYTGRYKPHYVDQNGSTQSDVDSIINLIAKKDIAVIDYLKRTNDQVENQVDNMVTGIQGSIPLVEEVTLSGTALVQGVGTVNIQEIKFVNHATKSSLLSGLPGVGSFLFPSQLYVNGRPAQIIEKAEQCSLYRGSKGQDSVPTIMSRVFNPISAGDPDKNKQYAGCFGNNTFHPERCFPENAEQPVFDPVGGKETPNVLESFTDHRACFDFKEKTQFDQYLQDVTKYVDKLKDAESEEERKRLIPPANKYKPTKDILLLDLQPRANNSTREVKLSMEDLLKQLKISTNDWGKIGQELLANPDTNGKVLTINFPSGSLVSQVNLQINQKIIKNIPSTFEHKQPTNEVIREQLKAGGISASLPIDNPRYVSFQDKGVANANNPAQNRNPKFQKIIYPNVFRTKSVESFEQELKSKEEEIAKIPGGDIYRTQLQSVLNSRKAQLQDALAWRDMNIDQKHQYMLAKFLDPQKDAFLGDLENTKGYEMLYLVSDGVPEKLNYHFNADFLSQEPDIEFNNPEQGKATPANQKPKPKNPKTTQSANGPKFQIEGGLLLWDWFPEIASWVKSLYSIGNNTGFGLACTTAQHLKSAQGNRATLDSDGDGISDKDDPNPTSNDVNNNGLPDGAEGVATVKVTSSKQKLLADGTDQLEILVEVKDTQGNTLTTDNFTEIEIKLSHVPTKDSDPDANKAVISSANPGRIVNGKTQFTLQAGEALEKVTIEAITTNRPKNLKSNKVAIDLTTERLNLISYKLEAESPVEKLSRQLLNAILIRNENGKVVAQLDIASQRVTLRDPNYEIRVMPAQPQMPVRVQVVEKNNEKTVGTFMAVRSTPTTVTIEKDRDLAKEITKLTDIHLRDLNQNDPTFATETNDQESTDAKGAYLWHQGKNRLLIKIGLVDENGNIFLTDAYGLRIKKVDDTSQPMIFEVFEKDNNRAIFEVFTRPEITEIKIEKPEGRFENVRILAATAKAIGGYSASIPAKIVDVQRTPTNGWLISTAKAQSKAKKIIDLDQDGLNDLEELIIGSDRENKDSDADGFQDLEELQKGYHPIKAQEKLFNDLDVDDESYADVIRLYRRGIISGYSDGSFRPNQTLTREEFIKIDLGTLCINCANLNQKVKTDLLAEYQQSPFPDQNFQPNLLACVAEGKKREIVSGYRGGANDGFYLPKNQITRAEATKVILETAKQLPTVRDGVNKEMNFSQVQPGQPWYFLYALEAQRLGIFPQGRFETVDRLSPTDFEDWYKKQYQLDSSVFDQWLREPITRGEFAIMASQLIDKIDCYLIDDDGDGVPDNLEIFQYGTDPSNADTDGGGVKDLEEIFQKKDPNNADDDQEIDTDKGGIADVIEIGRGSDPLDPSDDFPGDKDSDGDGMPDKWEEKFDLNPQDPRDASLDGDKDGLTNLGEYKNDTDPTDPDSDDGGMNDGDEIMKKLEVLDGGDDGLSPKFGSGPFVIGNNIEREYVFESDQNQETVGGERIVITEEMPVSEQTEILTLQAEILDINGQRAINDNSSVIRFEALDRSVLHANFQKDQQGVVLDTVKVKKGIAETKVISKTLVGDFRWTAQRVDRPLPTVEKEIAVHALEPEKIEVNPVSKILKTGGLFKTLVNVELKDKFGNLANYDLYTVEAKIRGAGQLSDTDDENSQLTGVQRSVTEGKTTFTVTSNDQEGKVDLEVSLIKDQTVDVERTLTAIENGATGGGSAGNYDGGSITGNITGAINGATVDQSLSTNNQVAGDGNIAVSTNDSDVVSEGGAAVDEDLATLALNAVAATLRESGKPAEALKFEDAAADRERRIAANDNSASGGISVDQSLSTTPGNGGDDANGSTSGNSVNEGSPEVAQFKTILKTAETLEAKAALKLRLKASKSFALAGESAPVLFTVNAVDGRGNQLQDFNGNVIFKLENPLLGRLNSDGKVALKNGQATVQFLPTEKSGDAQITVSGNGFDPGLFILPVKANTADRIELKAIDANGQEILPTRVNITNETKSPVVVDLDSTKKIKVKASLFDPNDNLVNGDSNSEISLRLTDSSKEFAELIGKTKATVNDGTVEFELKTKELSGPIRLVASKKGLTSGTLEIFSMPKMTSDDIRKANPQALFVSLMGANFGAVAQDSLAGSFLESDKTLAVAATMANALTHKPMLTVRPGGGLVAEEGLVANVLPSNGLDVPLRMRITDQENSRDLAEIFLFVKQQIPLNIINPGARFPSGEGIMVQVIDRKNGFNAVKNGNTISITENGTEIWRVNDLGQISLVDNNFQLEVGANNLADYLTLKLLKSGQEVAVISIVQENLAPAQINQQFSFDPKLTYQPGIVVKPLEMSNQVDFKFTQTGNSTAQLPGIVIVNLTEPLTDDQLPGFSHLALEDALEQPGIGFVGANKHVLNFAGGNSAGEALMPYPAESGILLGDPLIRLNARTTASKTGFTQDIGKTLLASDDVVQEVIVMDYNADKLEDVFVAYDDGRIALLENRNSYPKFRNRGVALNIANGILSVANGDLNNDGLPDLIVATQEPCVKGDVCVDAYINKSGFFVRENLGLEFQERIHQLEAADLNQDGFADLVATDFAGDVKIFWNEGKNKVSFEQKGQFLVNLGLSIDRNKELKEEVLVGFQGMPEPNKAIVGGDRDFKEITVTFPKDEKVADYVKRNQGRVADPIDEDVLPAPPKGIPNVTYTKDAPQKQYKVQLQYLDAASGLAKSSKKGVDLNGAQLVAGDEVQYTINLVNDSNKSLENLMVSDVVPDIFEVNTESIECTNCQQQPKIEQLGTALRPFVIRNFTVPANDSRQIVYTAKVKEVPKVKVIVGHDLDPNYPSDTFLDIGAAPEINPTGQMVYFYSKNKIASNGKIQYERYTTPLAQPTTPPQSDPNLATKDPTEIAKSMRQQAAQEATKDSDGDGLPDQWDALMSGLGAFEDGLNKTANTIESAVSALKCQGGCLANPVNISFLTPGAFNIFGTPAGFDPGLPVLAAGIPSIVPVWPPSPYQASQFRLYLSPTTTLGLGTSVCTGPYLVPGASWCFSFAAPIGQATGACNKINGAISTAIAKAQTAVNQGSTTVLSTVGLQPGASVADPVSGRSETGGLSGNQAVGGGSVKAGLTTNVSVPGFPAILTNWLDRQVEEVVTKLTDLPDIYFIYPDFSSLTGGAKVPSGNINGLSKALTYINSIPLVRVETQEVTLKIPLMTKQEIKKARADWKQWIRDAKLEVEQAKKFWKCDKNSKHQQICKRLLLSAENTIQTMEENLKRLKEYEKLPRKIRQWREAEVKYINQIICYLDAIMQFTTGYLDKQSQRINQWQNAIKAVKKELKGWKAIIDLAVEYQQSCDQCKSDRFSLLEIVMKVFTVIPEPPVIPFPKWPDIVIDVSHIQAGATITWPDLKFEAERVTVPKIPRLRLPDVIVPEFAINTPSLPKIPRLPRLPDFPELPDMPPIPIPQLPDLPPPPEIPKLPKPVVTLTTSVKTILKILCLVKSGLVPLPEANLKSHIETLTARGLEPALPIDLLGSFQFPKISYQTVDRISIKTILNFQLDLDFIYTTIDNTAQQWNQLSGNLIKSVNQTTNQASTVLENAVNKVDTQVQKAVDGVGDAVKSNVDSVSDRIDNLSSFAEPTQQQALEAIQQLEDSLAEYKQKVAEMPTEMTLVASAVTVQRSDEEAQRHVNEIRERMAFEQLPNDPAINNLMAARNNLIAYVDQSNQLLKESTGNDDLIEFNRILVRNNGGLMRQKSLAALGQLNQGHQDFRAGLMADNSDHLAMNKLAKEMLASAAYVNQSANKYRAGSDGKTALFCENKTIARVSKKRILAQANGLENVRSGLSDYATAKTQTAIDAGISQAAVGVDGEVRLLAVDDQQSAAGEGESRLLAVNERQSSGGIVNNNFAAKKLIAQLAPGRQNPGKPPLPKSGSSKTVTTSGPQLINRGVFVFNRHQQINEKLVANTADLDLPSKLAFIDIENDGDGDIIYTFGGDVFLKENYQTNSAKHYVNQVNTEFVALESLLPAAAAVNNFRVTDINHGSVDLAWRQAAESEIAGYEIIYRSPERKGKVNILAPDFLAIDKYKDLQRSVNGQVKVKITAGEVVVIEAESLIERTSTNGTVIASSGDEIVTKLGATATVEFSDGTIAKLAEDTSMVVPAANDKEIAVHGGNVTVEPPLIGSFFGQPGAILDAIGGEAIMKTTGGGEIKVLNGSTLYMPEMAQSPIYLKTVGSGTEIRSLAREYLSSGDNELEVDAGMTVHALENTIFNLKIGDTERIIFTLPAQQMITLPENFADTLRLEVTDGAVEILNLTAEEKELQKPRPGMLLTFGDTVKVASGKAEIGYRNGAITNVIAGEPLEIIELEDISEPKLNLKMPNGTYWAAIYSFDRSGIRSTQSQRITLMPQTCADRQGPIVDAGSSERRVSIYKTLEIDASKSVDNTGLIAKYYIDNDLKLDSDGNGDPTDDQVLFRDLNANNDKDGDGNPRNDADNPRIVVGPYQDLTSQHIKVWVEDEAGNKAGQKIRVDIFVPDVFVDTVDSTEGKVSGHIEPTDSNIPVALVRDRNGVKKIIKTDKANTEGKYLTDENGEFVIEDLDISDDIEVRNHKDQPIAEINGKTGRVKILKDGYRVEIRAAEKPFTPTRLVILDQQNNVMAQVVLIADGNTDTVIDVDVEYTKTEIADFAGVHLKDLQPKDQFVLRKIPSSDDDAPGGTEVVHKVSDSSAIDAPEDERLAVIDTLGNIYLLDKSLSLRLKKDFKEGDPVVIELLKDTVVLAEIYIAVGQAAEILEDKQFVIPESAKGKVVVDEDADGLPDDFELKNRLSSKDPSDAAKDSDGDGLSNLEEFRLKTNPRNPDSDNDGFSDSEEVAFGKNPAEKAGSPFVDVPTDHPQLQSIINLEQRNVIKGVNTPQGKFFSPEKQITRAEFTQIMLQVLCIVPRQSAYQQPAVFNDIPFSEEDLLWYYAITKESRLQGFIAGYVGETDPTTGKAPFKPNNSITRAEAAKIILEALEAQRIIDLSEVGVKSGEIWYAPYIQVAQDLKPYLLKDSALKVPFVLTKDEAQRPNEKITRADFVEMADRVLKVFNCFKVDDDNDGIPSVWEEKHGLNPFDPRDAELDPDRDGLINRDEYRYFTNPFDPDTDDGGVNDGDEVKNGTIPHNKPEDDPTDEDRRDFDIDSDGGGVSDGVERRRGTNPFLPDDDDRDPRSGLEPGVYVLQGECKTCPCNSTVDWKAQIRPDDQFFAIISNGTNTKIWASSEVE